MNISLLFVLFLLPSVCFAQQPGEFVITAREEFKVTATPRESAKIPISKSGWNNGGYTLAHSHLLEHGCPQWVIDKYANNPAMLHQIHDGYHAASNGWAVEYRTEYNDKPSKPQTRAAPTTVTKPGYTLDCNGRRCRWIRN